MQSVVKDLLQMQNQLRIFHWQTNSYSAHKALGKAYDNLSELIDTFVEVAMGRDSVALEDGNMNIELFDIKNISINEALDTYKVFLCDMSKRLNPERDTDLLNLRDEMLSIINQTCYLLKLS